MTVGLPAIFPQLRKKAKMAGTICRNFTRNISLFQTLRDSLRQALPPKEQLAAEEKFAKTSEMWKKIFLYFCIPSIGLCVVNVLLEERPERPEFRPYEHLRIRTRRYPWGDGTRSLFHNPHRNALPDGYETD